jgi:hypothetical protein
MDEVYDGCARRGNGEPKVQDQLKRWQENRCVYCGTPFATERRLLGVACDKLECQDKRWGEFNPTPAQELVFRRTWEAKAEKEIAYEMQLSPKSKRLKQLKQATAKKLWVRCDRVLLARCYGERLDHANRRNSHTPPEDTPPKSTPQKGTARVGTLHKSRLLKRIRLKCTARKSF